MPPTTFLRLLAADDKPTALRAAIAATRAAIPTPDAYTVDPASFRQIPGSPFAYWVSEQVRRFFAEFDALETKGREARRGSSTGDDFQRVRAWWEVSASLVGHAVEWASFAKGGGYSSYYYDIHLLADWDESRHTYRDFYGRPGREIERPEAVDYYFRPGLTYPRRTTSGLSVRAMPAGCIFADKGPAMFVAGDGEPDLLALLAIVNSAPFAALLELQLGAADVAARSYEVGLIQQMPVPDLRAEDERALATPAREAHDRKRDTDRDDEVTHPFTAPALVRLRKTSTLREAMLVLGLQAISREERLAAIQRMIDDRCFALYGFSEEDRAQVEGSAALSASDDASADEEAVAPEDEEAAEDTDGAVGAQASSARNAADLLMYAVGCAFGRWDVRIGRDLSLAPLLAEPFAPLPVCAPGALVGPDGLPASEQRIVSEAWLRARPDAITLPSEGSVAGAQTIAAADYPLEVAWDGILVDDPNAPNDIVRRIRATLELLWGARADAIEAEACGILGVRDLRDYLRNPRLFFDFHTKRYSKSRRKAPIYWLLQSPRRNYAIWLYYHRLDADLPFKALTLHLAPKIRLEEQRLDELEAARKAAGATGAEARRAAQAVEKQEALLADLREFHAALDRAARHYLTPDLNDGVLLNIAPYWEVVPWKEAKSAWQQLLAGKYEWSSIGRQLREKGLITAKRA